jgi:hypothetical protein
MSQSVFLLRSALLGRKTLVILSKVLTFQYVSWKSIIMHGMSLT